MRKGGIISKLGNVACNFVSPKHPAIENSKFKVADPAYAPEQCPIGNLAKGRLDRYR
jgi:hypothetical protein